jgi:hypothetical protein
MALTHPTSIGGPSGRSRADHVRSVAANSARLLALILVTSFVTGCIVVGLFVGVLMTVRL